MAKKLNTYKVKRKKKSAGVSFFSLLERWLKIDDFSIQRVSSEYLLHGLFLVFLGVLYIGNGHYGENTIRRIDKVQKEVEDLHADYHTLKADYMFDSKQSEVSQKVKDLGLQESSEPPIKIEVEE